MFAITAVAVSRVTGEPEYFVLRTLLAGMPDQPDPAAPQVVYSRHELVDFLDALGRVVVLRPGLPPQPVRVRYGTHGYRFVESYDDGQPTDALRKAPRFAFVGEATAGDLRRLGDIERGEIAAVAADAAAMRRYAELGWLRFADGVPALTEIGRALLAYA